MLPVCSPKLHLFKQKIQCTAKYYYFKLRFCIWTYFKMLVIPVMAKLNLQHHLHSSVSHDPSEIILICWFGAQETFHIIIPLQSQQDREDFHSAGLSLSFGNETDSPQNWSPADAGTDDSSQRLAAPQTGNGRENIDSVLFLAITLLKKLIWTIHFLVKKMIVITSPHSRACSGKRKAAKSLRSSGQSLSRSFSWENNSKTLRLSPAWSNS